MGSTCSRTRDPIQSRLKTRGVRKRRPTTATRRRCTQAFRQTIRRSSNAFGNARTVSTRTVIIRTSYLRLHLHPWQSQTRKARHQLRKRRHLTPSCRRSSTLQENEVGTPLNCCSSSTNKQRPNCSFSRPSRSGVASIRGGNSGPIFTLATNNNLSFKGAGEQSATGLFYRKTLGESKDTFDVGLILTAGLTALRNQQGQLAAYPNGKATLALTSEHTDINVGVSAGPTKVGEDTFLGKAGAFQIGGDLKTADDELPYGFGLALEAVYTYTGGANSSVLPNNYTSGRGDFGLSVSKQFGTTNWTLYGGVSTEKVTDQQTGEVKDNWGAVFRLGTAF